MTDMTTPDSPAPAPGVNTAQVARKATAAQKQKKALELRLGGASYEQIAASVPYSSRQAAHVAVKKALAAIPKEAAEELREVELARLDEMTLRLTARLRQGDLEVVTKLLRVMDSRAKLTGIYQLPEGAGDLASVAEAFGGLLASAQTFAVQYSKDGGDVPTIQPEA